MERNDTGVDVRNVGSFVSGDEWEDLTSSAAILKRLQASERRPSYTEPDKRQNEATMAMLLIAYHLALATERAAA